jgi:hypothetical protein
MGWFKKQQQQQQQQQESLVNKTHKKASCRLCF